MDTQDQSQTVAMDSAVKQYEMVKEEYERLVRRALMDPNPANKQSYADAIRSENQRLITIVQGLVEMYQQNKTAYTGISMEDLQSKLQEYKQQFVQLETQRDKNLQYQQMLNSSKTTTTTATAYYYGYAIAILVLLIGLLMSFFFIGTAPSITDTVVSAIETPVTTGIGDVVSEAGQAVTEAGQAAVQAGQEAVQAGQEAAQSIQKGVTINIQGAGRSSLWSKLTRLMQW
jgi:hypothetical protein